MAVEHGRLAAAGVDRGDQQGAFRPVLAGQPGRDGSAPAFRPGTVGGGVQFDGGRAHSATHVGCVLGCRDDRAGSLQVLRRRLRAPGRWRGGSGEDGFEQFGRTRAGQLDGGRRAGRGTDGSSAVVTSRPASNRPATTPIDQALAEDPPPPSTSAHRSPKGVAFKGVVFMGVAFRELPGGAPGGD